MLTDYFLSHNVWVFASGWTRFALSFGLSFFIMLAFGRPFISAMRVWQKKGQPISENAPSSHQAKAGTPTMGGLLILAAILVSVLLFMPLRENASGWIAIASLVMFGALGFADVFKKVHGQSHKASNGLSPALRLIIGAIFVGVLAYFINRTMPPYMPEYSIALASNIIWPVPMLPEWLIGGRCGLILMPVIYYVFAYFVICGSANATNITDGLDGMLAKLYMPVLVVLVVALYGATRIGFMDTVMFLPGASGLYAPLGAAFGAVLGFLWYNGRPASIFMGDVGSLALGGFMGTVAMLLKSELIMGVAAFMMVMILLSSFIQTMFFKLSRRITGTGRRVFRRAPLHHHFEELGWPETKIVERFFVMSILFSGLALVLLKFA